jgi:hypothetical protein
MTALGFFFKKGTFSFSVNKNSHFIFLTVRNYQFTKRNGSFNLGGAS